ncbi:TetR family transcriptional regulator [Teredinibacter purpureus]|uniref:TetR family transcriptional regulator n=1 Tax=Teredinibacter purpureus TaxID=2731756 RepID=UPI0006973D7C|nr:TetR family transcriptional regulator [Teredinibacter purpureus]
MARKTKEDTEKTRHALLDAATRIFSEQGVANTTLHHIACAADMTRGAVYWHFKNKDDVIKSLWERSTSGPYSAFITSLQALGTTELLLEFTHILQTTIRSFFTDPNLHQAMRIIISSQEFTLQASELQRFFDERKKHLHASMRSALSHLQQHKAIRQDVPLSVMADSLWAYTNGLIHTHPEIFADATSIEQHCNQLLSLWIDGIRPRNEHPPL